MASSALLVSTEQAMGSTTCLAVLPMPTAQHRARKRTQGAVAGAVLATSIATATGTSNDPVAYTSRHDGTSWVSGSSASTGCYSGGAAGNHHVDFSIFVGEAP